MSSEWTGSVEPTAKIDLPGPRARSAESRDAEPARRRAITWLPALLSFLLITSCMHGHHFGARHERASTPRAPRLVLQITVDQLRGDLVRRHADQWGEGGFKRLLEEGAYFANAHHAHANTETVVGHSTLATGAHPSTHGMVGNLWMDRVDGIAHYNVEDAEFPVLSTKPLVNQETEIDPTQRAATSDGRSPRSLEVSTFGDELKLFTGGEAKVFGVSVKDRGAITLAGHTGKAYWFSKSTGEFVTSAYYTESYPDWVSEWNAAGKVAAYADTTWKLDPSADYMFADRDDRPFETALPGYGRTFPHAFGPADNPYFTTFLTLSPAGDELTLDFAESLLLAEQLGQDEVTDYLSVSFSSTDYVGHIFGPSSLEAEANLLRLDRTLARLLKRVDELVGLDNTLVVLSADHGGPDTPGALQAVGADAAYIADSEEMGARLGSALEQAFGPGESLVQGFFHPYVYLDREQLAARGLSVEEVAEVAATALAREPSIAHAFTREMLSQSANPDNRIARSVLHNDHPARSGDVYLVTRPNHFVNDFDGLTVAATHGSPWRYDTHVPIIFLGRGIRARTVQREVFTVDVAASLAALVGTSPPTGCEGAPLLELFDTHTNQH